MAKRPILGLKWRFSLILLFLAAVPCAAAPLYPFQVLCPLPMQGGEINLRLGASFVHRDHLLFHDADNKRETAELPSIRGAVSVAPNSEIHFSYPLLYLDQEGQGSEYGSGDAILSGLFTPLGVNAREIAWGIKFGVKLPNADDEKGFGTDETDFFAGLVGAREAGRYLAVVNADFGILGEPHSSITKQDDVLIYNFVCVRNLGEGAYAGLGIEGLGLSRFGNNRLAAGAAFSFPWRSVDMDIGLGYGLAGKAPDWSATVGVSFRFSTTRENRYPATGGEKR